jgi:hypothetical protein
VAVKSKNPAAARKRAAALNPKLLEQVMKTTSIRRELYERVLRKYRRKGDELQVMEMADGYERMLKSHLYKDYVALAARLEKLRACLNPSTGDQS